MAWSTAGRAARPDWVAKLRCLLGSAWLRPVPGNHRRVYRGASPGRGDDLELAADRFDAVAHTGNADPVTVLLERHPGPVIAHGELDRIRSAREPDGYFGIGSGMLGRVLDRLTSTEVQRRFDRLRGASDALVGDLDRSGYGALAFPRVARISPSVIAATRMAGLVDPEFRRRSRLPRC
jgi:hypothetical protein